MKKIIILITLFPFICIGQINMVNNFKSGLIVSGNVLNFGNAEGFDNNTNGTIDVNADYLNLATAGADLKFANAETLDNDVDGTINTSEDFKITGNDLTFGNGEGIDNNTNGQIDVNGILNCTSNVVIQGVLNYGTDAGSSDDYSIATGITAFTTGMVIYFYANTANTGACTIDIDGAGALTAKSLKSLHDQDPADNYIETGSIVHAIYDGTNFQILSPDANP